MINLINFIVFSGGTISSSLVKDKANNGNAVANLNTGVTVDTCVKFDDNTPWSTIVKAVQDGKTQCMNVGDKKEVALNGFTGTFTLRIANKSTPSECSQENFSQTACGFVVEFQDIITKHTMNPAASNVGGWEASEMRKYLNVIDGEEGSGTIYNALPDDLKVGIKDTKVVSGHGSRDTSNFTTTDKLYLLSPHEVWEDKLAYDSAYDQTRQLDYYLNRGVATNDYSEAIKYYDGTATSWWLRGAYSNLNSRFYRVNYNGDWSNYAANRTDGVAPAFRIG